MTAYPSHVEIAPNEFTETIGLEFDALQPGMVIEHRPGFAFSWSESRDRSRIAGDHAPAVIDPAFAAAVGGGHVGIAETWLLTAVTAATTRTFGRVVANLAWEDVHFPRPVRDGEFIFAESTILNRRISKSRPNQGVLSVATRGLTRDGIEVCRYRRTLLVYRSAEGPHKAAGYV
jgi:itaconyl-CoA hydratase